MKQSFPKSVWLLLLILAMQAGAVTRYVDVNSLNPAPPYTSWATASTNIQIAIDAALVGDEIVVTNGVYATGGRAVFGTMTNRVAVDKPLSLRSVNGPQFTVIQGRQVPGTTNGDGAIRCVFLADGASLSGFTLTNGATRDWRGDYYYEQDGGGLWCESYTSIVSNCIVAGNSAKDGGGGASGGTLNNCALNGNSAGSGGGVEGSVLNNCTLTSNSAGAGGGAHRGRLDNCVLTGNSAGQGGGAYSGVLNNCTLTGNSAAWGGGVVSYSSDSMLNNCALIGNSAQWEGGGAYYGTLNYCTVISNQANGTFLGEGGGGAAYSDLRGCIVYFNAATNGANYWESFLNYCCTTPLPSGAIGNITNAPLLLDPAIGNLQLRSNSACINAGLNANAAGSTDLGGNSRIVGGTVDLGAYEFQSPSSVLSYAWAGQYGLPTDGSVDATDADGDGANNWHEWRADTIPTNPLSVLLMVTATNGPAGAIVTWQSVVGRTYWLERATNFGPTAPFWIIATFIPGAVGAKTFTDPAATNGGPYFYRVGVH